MKDSDKKRLVSALSSESVDKVNTVSREIIRDYLEENNISSVSLKKIVDNAGVDLKVGVDDSSNCDSSWLSILEWGKERLGVKILYVIAGICCLIPILSILGVGIILYLKPNPKIKIKTSSKELSTQIDNVCNAMERISEENRLHSRYYGLLDCLVSICSRIKRNKELMSDPIPELLDTYGYELIEYSPTENVECFDFIESENETEERMTRFAILSKKEKRIIRKGIVLSPIYRAKDNNNY